MEPYELDLQTAYATETTLLIRLRQLRMYYLLLQFFGCTEILLHVLLLLLLRPHMYCRITRMTLIPRIYVCTCSLLALIATFR